MSNDRAQPTVDVRRISAELGPLELQRGHEGLGQWPDAEIVPVKSHWNIPEVHGDECKVQRWVRIKTEALVLSVEKSLAIRPPGHPAEP